MKYPLAVICPPLAFLACGKWFRAAVSAALFLAAIATARIGVGVALDFFLILWASNIVGEYQALREARAGLRGQGEASRRSLSPGPEQPPNHGDEPDEQEHQDTEQDHGKREARLATWRESIRQEMAPQLPVASEEDKRMAMIRERERLEMEKQQHAMAANVRDTMFDNMMRRGDMLDAHREALRRMQASANKNA